MINYFIGQPSAQLVIWLREAQEALAAGQTVIQVDTRAGSGGNSTTGKIEVDVRERIELLLGALNLLDPVTYPSSVRKVSKTRVRVYQGNAEG